MDKSKVIEIQMPSERLQCQELQFKNFTNYASLTSPTIFSNIRKLKRTQARDAVLDHMM